MQGHKALVSVSISGPSMETPSLLEFIEADPCRDNDMDQLSSLELCSSVRVSPQAALESQKSVLATIEHLHQEINALQSKYNALAFVHQRLHPELLMEVFAHLDHEEPRAITYTHVCRTWRTLIHRLPEFWAGMLAAVPTKELSLGPSEEFITFLARSGSSPLTLDLPTFGSSMYDALMPHAHHLSSLSVRVSTSGAACLYRMLSRGVPLLEGLSIFHEPSSGRLDTEDAAAHRFICFSDQALPRLRHIRIPLALLCPGLAASTSTLKFVDLDGCRECFECENRAETQSLGDILSVLRGSPSLEKIRFLPGSYALQPEANSSVEQVHVPALQELMFESDNSSFISEVLGHLVLPLSTVISVTCGAIPDMTLQAVLQNRNVLLCTRKVRFIFNSNTRYQVRCSLSGPSHLCLDAPLDDSGALGEADRTISTALGVFPSPFTSLKFLYLSVWSPETYAALSMQTGIEELLARFPCLTTLQMLWGCPDDLFMALAAPDPEDEHTELPCPDLRHLRITWKITRRYATTAQAIQDSCELMRTVLEGRAGRGGALDSFEFRVIWMRRLHGPVKETPEEMEGRLNTFFEPVAGEVKVAIHTGRML
ncbi:hypothetical protein BV20DRAFT_1123976 [Pilatotrama ljubarskyi]|nr:hypothetical protein BV20DRAFT_1123976 [Pilatotrama ljubarskyi]